MRGDLSIKPLSWPTYPDDNRSCLVNPKQGVVGYNLILSGRSADLDHIVQDESIRTKIEGLVDAIRLGSLIQERTYQWQAILDGFADLEIRLYNLASDTSEDKVWSLIATIYELATQRGLLIFADPNFLTAAPNSAGGGSGGTTGGPIGKLGRPTTEDDNIRHWAYTATGIYLEDGNSTRLVADVTGKNVPIFVYDSCDRRLASELNLVRPEEGKQVGPNQYEIWRQYPTKPLRLNISSPASRFHLEKKNRRPVRVEASNDQNRDVDEHGLFVSGIIHRVAPDSQIHLVDVLNREGRGEIYGLIRALYLLLEQSLTDQEALDRPPLEGVVLNLSLGTSLSEVFMSSTNIHSLLTNLRSAMYRSPTTPNHLLLSILDDMTNHNYYVGALRLIIRLLYEGGAIIVAAAGNESATVEGERPKQIPASYPEVIAVAASTHTRHKANFSNLGDIMAPGGGKATPDVQSPHYEPDTEPWDVYRQNHVLGLVPKLVADHSGYAYWQGTSFSAPFVTGLVALMIEKLRDKERSLHPNHIRTLILKHSSEGIINVPSILGQIK